MPAAHVMTPRVASRTTAPPFEQRHQKSNMRMRQSGANLAGLPLVTFGGNKLSRHLSYHNLRSYLAFPGAH
jgi:hypothetical protein